jgi:hypothetical protein
MASALSNAMGFEEPNDLCPSLTFQQRLYGFGGCLVLGIVFAIMSWISFMTTNFVMFAIMITMSNISSISASLFLAGPTKQLKSMFEETRLIATIVYLVSMVLTIFVAVVLKIGILVILCCIVQYCAMIWYGLSYIPFARNAVKSCLKGVINLS